MDGRMTEDKKIIIIKKKRDGIMRWRESESVVQVGRC